MIVRIYISQDQKTTETSTAEQFNFVMRYSRSIITILLPHRNPAVLWFNSRELETKPFYKNQRKIRALVLRSMAGVKSLLHERLQLQTPLEKLKRKVSEKAAAAFFRLCCYRCKLKVFESTATCCADGMDTGNTDSERKKFQQDGTGKKIGFGN